MSAPRIEFPAKVRKAAYARSGGRCEECGLPFGKHPKNRVEYDHAVPAALGGDASLDNCIARCGGCHRLKTSGTDIPMIAKARRGEKAMQNTQRRKAAFPGSRASNWKRKLDGTVERRDGR